MQKLVKLNQVICHLLKVCLITTIFFIIIFCPIWANGYYQQLSKSYIINKRCGSEIHKQERDYFYLFPGITDFEAAYFSKKSTAYAE